MNFPLRLPPLVDSKVRAEAQRLGVSLNAFITIALDAYVRGVVQDPDQLPADRQARADEFDQAAFKARQLGLQGLEDPKPALPLAQKKKPPRKPLDGPAILKKQNEGSILTPEEKATLRAYRETQKAAKRR